VSITHACLRNAQCRVVTHSREQFPAGKGPQKWGLNSTMSKSEQVGSGTVGMLCSARAGSAEAGASSRAS
jgi:hypothetical protein